jgi:hypothetical protein
MGCGCGGSTLKPPVPAAVPRERVVTNPNDPRNYFVPPTEKATGNRPAAKAD